MRSRISRILVVLVATLGLAAGCGKYSINNLRATQAFQNGNISYQRGEWPKAIEDYSRAVSLNPQFGYAYFFLGNSYDNLFKPSKRGEPENDAYLEKAIANYKLAIENLKGSDEPSAPKILKLSYQYLIAAYGSDKLNDIEKAVPVAQDLIATEPNDPTNYQALAKLYEENGLYEEAEANFKKAIEVKPEDPLSYEVLAGYYSRQGEFEKSMEALTKRAELEPKNPEAWHALAARYSEEALKNTKLSKAKASEYVTKGLEVEEKALEVNPEYFEALTYKDIMLRQAATYEKDHAKQLELLRQADQIKAKATQVQRKQSTQVTGK